MENEIKIVAITKEVKDNETKASQIQRELTEFSGKAAGVCYMHDDYFETGIEDVDKAYNRAVSTAKRGHQSPFDHSHITFKIQASKALVMVLNSMGVYTTSEKSARYTLMTPDTPREEELYNKWIAKIQDMVLTEFPDYDDELIKNRLNKRMKQDNIVEGSTEYEELLAELKKSTDLPSYKAAQENARYMISVFTKTVLLYTVSYRQAMLIIQYFNKFYDKYSDSKNGYYSRLSREMKDFALTLSRKIGDDVITDNKNQSVRFIEETLSDKKDNISDSYTIRYICSFACLAQLQRHRTIRHSMYVFPLTASIFYTPDIVKKYDCEKEWIEDIRSVEKLYPQGMMVSVSEQGIVEDFVLKCKERLCGRAFKETMDNVRDNTEKFVRAALNGEMCKSNAELVIGMTAPGIGEDAPDAYTVVPRCAFKDFNCTDGCRWGKKQGLNRII